MFKETSHVYSKRFGDSSLGKLRQTGYLFETEERYFTIFFGFKNQQFCSILRVLLRMRRRRGLRRWAGNVGDNTHGYTDYIESPGNTSRLDTLKSQKFFENDCLLVESYQNIIAAVCLFFGRRW